MSPRRAPRCAQTARRRSNGQVARTTRALLPQARRHGSEMTAGHERHFVEREGSSSALPRRHRHVTQTWTLHADTDMPRRHGHATGREAVSQKYPSSGRPGCRELHGVQRVSILHGQLPAPARDCLPAAGTSASDLPWAALPLGQRPRHAQSRHPASQQRLGQGPGSWAAGRDADPEY